MSKGIKEREHQAKEEEQQRLQTERYLKHIIDITIVTLFAFETFTSMKDITSGSTQNVLQTC